jgi:hypothetical protein
MLVTDAWAYLNIRHPLCAWGTYRAVLVCPPAEQGFVSVWMTSALQDENPARLARELSLEKYRAFPSRVSRLRGMYCFMDIESAERAMSRWGRPKNHFRPEFLAELSLSEAGQKRDRLDSNWITHAQINEKGLYVSEEWISHYWAGDPYPDAVPIWETIVDGRLVVLGTELRERAYANVKKGFPDSLMFLEISRQAAWVGSDLGSISGWIRDAGNEFVLEYLMDMRDAENPEFLQKLTRLREAGHPMRVEDMKPHIENDSFGSVPDFRKFSFRRPKPALDAHSSTIRD